MDDRRDEDAALIAALRAASRSFELAGGDVDRHPEDGAFASYVSGNLETPERERFERHVSRCDRCAEDLAEIARLESAAALEGSHTPIAVADRISPATEDGWRRPSSASAGARRELSAGRVRGRSRTGVLARRLSIAAAAVLGLTVGLVGGGNYVLGRMAPGAAARLGTMLGRSVQIGDLSLAFVPEPAIRVRDFRVADDPRFSSDALVSLASADLAVDPASLWRGRLYGSVQLQRPVLRLVRDPVGDWNVEAVSGGPSDERAPDVAALPKQGSPPSDAKVRLVSADIRSGTLAVTDRSGGRERDLVLHDVDLAYRAPNTSEPSTVSLEGKIGDQAVVLRGQIGPFEGAAVPEYRFAEVSLTEVDLADVPGAPAALTGRMSFAGRLEGAGRSLDAIVRSAIGEGSLDLCCGALAQRNLDRDLIAALESIAGPAGRLSGVLGSDPAAAAVLAADATEYERLGGRVNVDPARLAFSQLGVQTRLFTAATDGGLTRDGVIDVSGRITLGPELTQAVLAAAPALRAALERRGTAAAQIALPFTLAGRWPDVALRVDVASTLRTAASALDPRRLAWSLQRPLARG